jgi:hypothetical protein
MKFHLRDFNAMLHYSQALHGSQTNCFEMVKQAFRLFSKHKKLICIYSKAKLLISILTVNIVCCQNIDIFAANISYENC